MGLPSTVKAMTFVLTANRPRAIGFYRDMLGLTMRGEDAHAATFDLGDGTEMRLTDIAGHVAGPHTVLGWTVPDLAATAAALAAKGVRFEIYEGFGQTADGVWTSPDGATKIAWFLDPDGNNLSLIERGAAAS